MAHRNRDIKNAATVSVLKIFQYLFFIKETCNESMLSLHYGWSTAPQDHHQHCGSWIRPLVLKHMSLLVSQLYAILSSLSSLCSKIERTWKSIFNTVRSDCSANEARTCARGNAVRTRIRFSFLYKTTDVHNWNFNPHSNGSESSLGFAFHCCYIFWS